MQPLIRGTYSSVARVFLAKHLPWEVSTKLALGLVFLAYPGMHALACPGMNPKHASKRDPNEDAADVVVRSTEQADALPSDVEASWQDWSKRVKGLDERTNTLLRAAFEAGVAAAQRASPGSALGRLGASKGGQARAAKLSKKRRVQIAKKAGRARWKTT